MTRPIAQNRSKQTQRARKMWLQHACATFFCPFTALDFFAPMTKIEENWSAKTDKMNSS